MPEELGADRITGIETGDKVSMERTGMGGAVAFTQMLLDLLSNVSP